MSCRFVRVVPAVVVELIHQIGANGFEKTDQSFAQSAPSRIIMCLLSTARIAVVIRRYSGSSPCLYLAAAPVRFGSGSFSRSYPATAGSSLYRSAIFTHRSISRFSYFGSMNSSG